jgi:hypothetical protein
LPAAVLVLIAVGAVAWTAQGRSGVTSPPGTALSTTTAPTSTTTTTIPSYIPPPVAPIVTPAEAGEGLWVSEDAWSGSPPSIMTTSFRPDAADPGIVAYATWMRTSSTQLALYPGYEGPGPTTLDRGPEMVPVAARQTLLATFNSGFYEKDAAAGFYVDNTLYFPMVNGLATVVEYTNGSVDVVDWEGGSTPGPTVVMARQNLPLLVANHAATADTAVPSDWGVTLGGVLAVWRTGLGIDDRGNLLYVAAPNQTAATLAQILVKLGAVRAIELDINPEWPIFVTYGAPGAANPALVVPNPNQIPNRFLYSSTKDFFAVFQRPPVLGPQPW